MMPTISCCIIAKDGLSHSHHSNMVTTDNDTGLKKFRMNSFALKTEAQNLTPKHYIVIQNLQFDNNTFKPCEPSSNVPIIMTKFAKKYTVSETTKIASYQGRISVTRSDIPEIEIVTNLFSAKKNFDNLPDRSVNTFIFAAVTDLVELSLTNDVIHRHREVHYYSISQRGKVEDSSNALKKWLVENNLPVNRKKLFTALGSVPHTYLPVTSETLKCVEKRPNVVAPPPLPRMADALNKMRRNTIALDNNRLMSMLLPSGEIVTFGSILRAQTLVPVAPPTAPVEPPAHHGFDPVDTDMEPNEPPQSPEIIVIDD